jgi:dTDP-4-dehydrorhamnose 3,5-epimerase
MRFIPLDLEGAYLIEPELREDDRGFFARVWCVREMEEAGLESALAQASIAQSRRKGTLRGMHFQLPPHGEVKLVRCTAGAIFDAIVDLRPDSPTFLHSTHVVLSAENRKALYVPKGFAHGYQTLEENTEVFYQMSEFYTPGAEGGIRWDDPRFKIPWPNADPRILSEKDRALPFFQVDQAAIFAGQPPPGEGSR